MKFLYDALRATQNRGNFHNIYRRAINTSTSREKIGLLKRGFDTFPTFLLGSASLYLGLQLGLYYYLNPKSKPRENKINTRSEAVSEQGISSDSPTIRP